MKSSTVNPQSRCPACQANLGMATDPTGIHKPTAGYLTVCVYCTQICVFNTDMSVRSMNSDEYEALDSETRAQLAHYRMAIGSFYILGKKGAS